MAGYKATLQKIKETRGQYIELINVLNDEYIELGIDRPVGAAAQGFAITEEEIVDYILASWEPE